MTDNTTAPQGQREQEVPGRCVGELCGICGQQAMAKVEEVIFDSDPMQMRHPLTQYLCADHASMVLQPYQHREGGCPFCEHTGVHPRFLFGRRAPTQEEGELRSENATGTTPRSRFMRGGPGMEGVEADFDARVRAAEDASAALDRATGVPTPPSAEVEALVSRLERSRADLHRLDLKYHEATNRPYIVDMTVTDASVAIRDAIAALRAKGGAT